MHMIPSTSSSRDETPAAEFGGIAPRRGSRNPPQCEVEYEKMPEDDLEQCTRHLNGTAWQPDEIGLEWTINTGAGGREAKTAREILDKIAAATLCAAQNAGGTKQQIIVNRDRIAALLEQREEWETPDEVYADEAWEICIVWRSRYGMVEFGTEEDGRVGYYVKRTFNGQNEEGFFEDNTKDELRRVMSWLDEIPEGN